MINDSDMRNVIRDNLKRLRVENDKTQLDIAKFCGKSENAVGSWEQGLSLPDIVTIAKLAQLYSVPIDSFYKEVLDET
jgi:transcriptional regulator with XRE-family HTH domain